MEAARDPEVVAIEVDDAPPSTARSSGNNMLKRVPTMGGSFSLSRSSSSSSFTAADKEAATRIELEETIEELAGGLDDIWVGVLNVVLLILFCLAPSVSRRIFSAWSCNTYTYDDATGEERSFLRDDPSMRCSDDDHDSADHDDLTELATGFLVLWPIIVPALWLLLLLLSRASIIGRTPTILSRSTKFLWADYEPGGTVMNNGAQHSPGNRLGSPLIGLKA